MLREWAEQRLTLDLLNSSQWITTKRLKFPQLPHHLLIPPHQLTITHRHHPHLRISRHIFDVWQSEYIALWIFCVEGGNFFGIEVGVDLDGAGEDDAGLLFDEDYFSLFVVFCWQFW